MLAELFASASFTAKKESRPNRSCAGCTSPGGQKCYSGKPMYIHCLGNATATGPGAAVANVSIARHSGLQTTGSVRIQAVSERRLTRIAGGKRASRRLTCIPSIQQCLSRDGVTVGGCLRRRSFNSVVPSGGLSIPAERLTLRLPASRRAFPPDFIPEEAYGKRPTHTRR